MELKKWRKSLNNVKQLHQQKKIVKKSSALKGECPKTKLTNVPVSLFLVRKTKLMIGRSRCMDGTCMEYFILLSVLRLFMSHWIAFLCEESRKLLDGENIFRNDRSPPHSLWKRFYFGNTFSRCIWSNIQQKTIKIKHIFTRIPEVVSRSLCLSFTLRYWPRFPLPFYYSLEWRTNSKRSPLTKARKVNDQKEQKEMHFICHVNHVWYLSSDLVPFNISWNLFYWIT